MLRLVAVPMMVLLGWIRAAMASPSIGPGQSAVTDGVIYGIFSSNIIRMAGIKPLHCGFAVGGLPIFCNFLATRCLALGGLPIFCLCGLALGGFFIFCLSLAMSRLAVGSFSIFCICLAISRLASFTLLVGFATRITITLKPVFVSPVFVKLRKWFDLLAFRTSLGYDLLRHNRFLNKRLCLEPVCSAILRSARLLYQRINPYLIKKIRNLKGK